MADANIGDAFGLAGTYEKGITIAGKYGTPRLYDTGEPTNVFPRPENGRRHISGAAAL
jgi:hypothetical protein